MKANNSAIISNKFELVAIKLMKITIIKSYNKQKVFVQHNFSEIFIREIFYNHGYNQMKTSSL